MEFTFFSTISVTLISVLSGIAFGFLLRKAAVSRFDTIVGQLLLKDFTVMKVILTAIAVGGIGIFLFDLLGWIPSFHLSETPILFSALGGAIFGVGMSVTGYCPGTAIAALAEGSKDMIFGFIGMLAGAALYNAFSPAFTPYMNERDIAFKQTIASYLNIPNWAIIAGLVIVWALFALVVKKLEQRPAIMEDKKNA